MKGMGKAGGRGYIAGRRAHYGNKWDRKKIHKLNLPKNRFYFILNRGENFG